MSAATTSTTTKPASKAVAVFIALLNVVIAAIKSLLTGTKPVTINSASTTWPDVTTVFQTAVDDYNATLSAKDAYTKAVAAQKVSVAAAKTQLKGFTAYVVMQYGDAAYKMFGLTPPKVKAPKSTFAKAASASKSIATRAAKKAALASITPATDEDTAQAAISAALSGGSSAPAPASPAPAAPAAAPAVKS